VLILQPFLQILKWRHPVSPYRTVIKARTTLEALHKQTKPIRAQTCKSQLNDNIHNAKIASSHIYCTEYFRLLGYLCRMNW